MLMLRLAVAAYVFSYVCFGEARGETMTTSWYQDGHRTASGMRFSANNPHIAAHKKLRFGTRLLLRNPANGRTLCVVVQDRGPFIRGRELDITRAGAKRLGFGQRGVVELAVSRVRCSM